MVLDNDTRGWIMTAMSGIACTLGASIICVDVLVRLLPGKRNFKIEDSDPFLSSSLSLSFGVMLFSALYNMLPSAKASLQRGGFSPKHAAWTLIGCFLGGVIGIRIASRVLHRFLPSHVVDCDHSHETDEHDKSVDPDFNRPASRPRSSIEEEQRSRAVKSCSQSQPQFDTNGLTGYGASTERDQTDARNTSPEGGARFVRRPSLQTQISQKVTQLVSSTKRYCDESGRCYGYTDPCGHDCFQIVQARRDGRTPLGPPAKVYGLSRSVTTPHPPVVTGEQQPLLQNVEEDAPLESIQQERPGVPPPGADYFNGDHNDRPNGYALHPAPHRLHSTQPMRKTYSHSSISSMHSHDSASEHAEPHDRHHHHVPTNAFLSIGLQTSLAIALHKLPEGFITYATNHANPQLGFAVFLALFIHNITEGFAMALPLYLAVGSRWKAMFWSALLGGVSQPLGAAVAALWFRLSGRSGGQGADEGVYGCMFAVTAGIMASVALQLFSESLDLTHNRNLCMAFAFVGMGILGISSALTA